MTVTLTSKNLPDPPGLNASESSFHSRLLDSLYDGVYFVNRERVITYWNQGAEKISGYSAQEAVGIRCSDNLLVHVNGAGTRLCLEGCPLSSTLADGERREAEVYLRHKQGHRVPVSVRVAAIRDAEGTILGAVEVFSDVSAKKRVERRASQLEDLAFRDALTGLPNRRTMELKVRQALQEAQELGRGIGLLMADLDDFKQVNDVHGHEAGDAALKAVSATLNSALRPEDTVGRWGGEEFLVLVRDVTPAALAIVAERCRKLVAQTAFPVGEHRLPVTISIGATLLDSQESRHIALQRADELMFASKRAGKNRVTLG